MVKYPKHLLVNLDSELALKLREKAEKESRSQSSIARQYLKENL